MLAGPSAEFAVPAVRMTFSATPDPAATASALAELVRELAMRAGLAEPGIHTRSRPTGDLVLAFTWQRRGQAWALGDAVAELAEGGLPAPEQALADAAQQVASARPGSQPDLIDPQVPTVAVTGTNGKTTTTRLLAAIAGAAGRCPGWSSTDGVYVAGELVAEGDWSGPGGAREVLERSEVDFAILETARGGLMQRGMAVRAVDVAVFTNVSTDHLGLQGLDTVADLAWAKSAVVRIARPTGWAVLNAEDPHVRNWHEGGPGRAWFFALDPDGQGAQFAGLLRAPLTTVVAGRIVVLGPQGPLDVIPVAEVPVTMAGLSQENVANALAATSAALAVGLPVAAVRAGLAGFVPDESAGAGRMNAFSVPLAEGGSCTVILDFAHNEAGAAALFRVARGLCPVGSRVHASIGNAGDRTDEGIREVGRLAAQAADTVQLAAKSAFLRGRTQEEMDALQLEGITAGGGQVAENLPDEPSGLAAMLARAGAGDVIAMMVHQDLAGCLRVLQEHGATPDGPAQIAAKAAAARGSSERT